MNSSFAVGSIFLVGHTNSLNINSGWHPLLWECWSWLLCRAPHQGSRTTDKQTQSACFFPAVLGCLPPATFNCQYQLCWPRLSCGRERLWIAASQDITQSFVSLFVLLAGEKKLSCLWHWSRIRGTPQMLLSISIYPWANSLFPFIL